MKFFREHKIIIKNSIIIIILCIIIIVSYKMEGNKGVLGKYLGDCFFTIEKNVNKLSDNVENKIGIVYRYKKLIKENEKLKKENNRLVKENINIKLKKHEIKQLENLKNVFEFVEYNENFKMKVANIIAIDNYYKHNSFIIDIGTDSGVDVGSVILDGNGLVGTIVEVSDSWARVTSIIDNNKNVSFKVLRDPNLLGIVKGNGKGELTGFMLDNKASVIDDDIIVTSGIGMYPEGIIIGKIKNIKYSRDTQLKTIDSEPSVSFSSLQKVLVLQ